MLERSPLVGRDVPRAQLVDGLARGRGGEVGLVLVSGDAGVGKSRLVADVLAGWRGRVLRGAFTPLGEFVCAGPERAEVDVLLGLVVREPLVLVLEDLHWAGAATVEALPGVAAACAGGESVVVATYRREELPRNHPVRAMRAEARRGGGLVEIVLGPLTAVQTGELLAGCLAAPVSDALVAAVHERAEGLPFYVEELAGALVESGGLRERDGVLDLAADMASAVPDSVLDAVLTRTADLRRQCPEAVELAAVLGLRVDLPVLAELVDPDEVDRVLDAGLLTEQGPGAAVFRHALVRDALYRAIPWARRRGHHRRVAERLAAGDRPPEVVAEHWAAAQEPDRARPLLLAAARRLCGAHAYRDAAGVVRRALSLWPPDVDPAARVDTVARLADCAELSGELESAANLWGEVARLRAAGGDGAAAGAAYRRLANVAELRGDVPAAVAAREAAADALAVAGLRGDCAAERLALAEQLKSAAHLSKALDHAEAAAEDAEAAGRTGVRAHALALQGAIRAALGEGRRGVALARSGLELALAGQLTEVAGEAYYELGEALEYAADYAAATDAYESALELSREHGFTALAQTCFVCMSPVVRLMGEWDRSLAICGEVLGDDRSSPLHRMVAQEESGLITVLRGDRRGVRAPLRQAVAFGRGNGVFGMEVGATWAIAALAVLDGDETAARHTVTGMLERCQDKEEWHYALPALRWSATYLAELGDRDGVARHHRLLATAATRNSTPKVLSALAHVGGELAVVEGDPVQAAAQFGQAVHLLRGVTAPFELALSRLRRGTALAAGGDRAPAVEAITDAYRIARRLGAKPLARQCAAELAAMGERVDRRLGRLAARSLTPAGLTRREQQVLGLLAEGRTNRQIAAELFLSTRTVDMHVRNLLTKLDCPSRGAAARRAVELGLVAPQTRQ
ncbi:LuxR C-terminal-related transcriptional regulator [Saccharothrix sp.]|uniref:LuxR C-terminal-related transcriptional regulator n=1 Tax=Saccharothrix sp. TaxID=1873460 RepID=UPI0028127BAB|nr:LuxR C-terminal-related transcriptional regulator [Saccharothrix sp.]